MNTAGKAGSNASLRLSLLRKLQESALWRSMFRSGYPSTDENRAMVLFNSFFLHVHPVKVKRHTLKVSYTFGLGVISVYLFFLLTITGGILMFLYVPSVNHAYRDMQALETSITFGMMLRNLHRWGAHLMVLVVFLHMCRVFYTGAYKSPREANWVIGIILWVLTLLLSFTGYLLPYDQLLILGDHRRYQHCRLYSSPRRQRPCIPPGST